MTTLNDTSQEIQRLLIQTELENSATQAQRNRMGQFATPPNLAQEILRYAKSVLPQNTRVRFLDPAIGTGSFYSAFLATFPANYITRAEGYEVDECYGIQTRHLWRETPLQLRISDFTKEPFPSEENDKFNLIICNPPYVRHQHIDREEKLVLQQRSFEVIGEKLSGLSGLYCYFMALSHGWLAENGISGWLVPSEFMDVVYGSPIKKYLLSSVTLLHIHRFDPNDVQFQDALVSSTIVWFKKAVPPPNHLVKFTYGGTLEAPAITKYISPEILHAESKWTRFPVMNPRLHCKTTALGDLFSIKRGLATGHNKFFILTPHEIETRKLPWSFFKPILPSPRLIKTNIIEADSNGLPIINPSYFLLDCNLPEKEIESKYPTLWCYLQEGVKKGVPNGYLCKNRNPWYSQENRPPSRLLCTYIGRTSSSNDRPFRFILNHSNATVANSYLVLYPKPLVARDMERDANLAQRLWAALNEMPIRNLLDEGRVYGGGLHKVEPRELSRVVFDSNCFNNVL
jgi:adenine-specific DNA-methyltransferase